MTLHAAAVLLLVLVFGALFVRSSLRRRCLGKCAGCPNASLCAAKNASKQEPLSPC